MKLRRTDAEQVYHKLTETETLKRTTTEVQEQALRGREKKSDSSKVAEQMTVGLNQGMFVIYLNR